MAENGWVHKCGDGIQRCRIHEYMATPWPWDLTCRREMDEKYHFSCQFTADLISMNHADAIITSTYQASTAARRSAVPDGAARQLAWTFLSPCPRSRIDAALMAAGDCRQ